MASYTILHGAKKNCGDFLIRDAATSLLEQTTNVSKDEIVYIDIVRSELSEATLNQVRATDVAFLAGGPGYRERFYPDTYPSMHDLLDATTVVPLGPGWKGTEEEEYVFSDEALSVLERIANQPDVPYLGARDLPSVRVLQNHGLPAKLTGCPGWYFYGDFPPTPSFDSGSGIQSIYISTPPKDDIRRLVQYLMILRFLSDEFPDARRVCVFHRGQNNRSFRPIVGYPWKLTTWKGNAGSLLYGIINRYARENGYEIRDVSGSSDYVKQYYEADMHIGYRVHAHIPALSAGTPSFLLQIDGRGTGVSESLGTDADIWANDGILPPVRRLKQTITNSMTNDFATFHEVEDNIEQGYEQMTHLIDSVT